MLGNQGKSITIQNTYTDEWLPTTKRNYGQDDLDNNNHAQPNETSNKQFRKFEQHEKQLLEMATISDYP